MFSGNTSLTGDVFNSFVKQQRLNPSAAAQGFGDDGFDVNVGKAKEETAKNIKSEEAKREEDLLLEGTQQVSQKRAGRGMPVVNTNEQRGYENVQNPRGFDMETMLPFDEASSSQKNFAGIVNSFNPQLFQVGENVVHQVAQMGPAAEKALGYKGSIYVGVSPDYMTNRLYIANTRRREESVYAFV